MGSEKCLLIWNNFETNIRSEFKELRDNGDFFDVTLACDDEQIQAHKMILSACSPHQHPLLYLKEVSVAQEDLGSFLAAAEELKVKEVQYCEDDECQDELEIDDSLVDQANSIVKQENKDQACQDPDDLFEYVRKDLTERSTIALFVKYSQPNQELRHETM